MSAEGGGEVVDQAQKVGVGLVVGAVGDQAHGAKGHAMVAANLGHGRAFHFDRQGVGQFGAQGLAFGGAADETVATDDQALVGARTAQVSPQPPLGPIGLQTGLGMARSLYKALAPDGVGGKSAEAVKRDDVAREQGRGVHVVLQKFGADHSITDLDLLAQPPRPRR